MKRFTETNKWSDPWFRALSGPAKLLWIYLTDHCDQIGLVALNLKFVSQDCGLPIKEKHLAELKDRLEAMDGGRYFIPKFIHFQYGELSADCPPHRTILKLVSIHNLTRSGLEYHYPNSYPTDSHKTRQDKTGSGQEEDKKGSEGSAEGNQPDPILTVIDYLNQKTGRKFRDTAETRSFISNRLAENGVTGEGVRQMIDRQCALWKNDDRMREFLRPETLFNATKFNAYYAAKDLPVTHETHRTTGGPGHRQPAGAEQRQLGIPRAELSIADARKAARAAAENSVAATPPLPGSDQSGSSTHG